MHNNNILAVWGNPGSGKSIVATKIAYMLSLRRKDVILVCCDSDVPTIPVIFPGMDTQGKSLGSILSSPEITQETICHNSLTLKKNMYLAVIGYQKGEGMFTYPAYTKSSAMDFIIQLRHIADYVIIDCSSFFLQDILSATVLEAADAVIRLGTCDFKALSYYATQLPYLSDKRFNPDRHIKVLSNYKSGQPVNEMKEHYGGMRFELPYVAELEEQYLSGALLNDLQSKQGKGFNEKIRTVIQEV